jgi:uncharacterized membrane protein (UPF0127 family)
MRQLLVLCAAAGLTLGACSGDDSSTTTSITPTAPDVTGTVATVPPSAAPGAIPEGYEAVVLKVTDAAGVVHEWCVLVADTDPKRERGLMEVDSLGGYDGMLFRFDRTNSASFYMYKTRLALSIAFFAAGGPFVSATDMPPCTADDGADCPLYRADAPYIDALEVPLGGLGALGVGPGSRIATGAACSRAPT